MDGGIQPAKGGALLVAALLTIVALLSGCGDSSSSGDESTATSETASAKSLGPGRTGAVLEPVDGSEASGTALVLPQTPKRTAHFKVKLEGLEPSTNGGQYVVWLKKTRHDMVPLYSYPVGKSGVFAHEWTPNPLHVGFVEKGTKDKFLITLAKNHAEHEETLDGGKTAYDPPFIGEPVAEGVIAGPRSGLLLGPNE